MLTKTSLTHTTRVLKLRLKDKHAAALVEMARDVNFVWNYANELSYKVWQRERRFMSEYDIDQYTAGATKAGLNLHSTTVQSISKELVTRRKQFKKTKLRWRVSRGSRRSLGWIPFKASALRYRNGQVLFSALDKPLSLWDSYGLADYKLGAGNFSEDARGRWYINITVKVEKKPRSVGKSAVGIDLGLKDFAALSTGQVVPAEQFYRDLEPKLAIAQRARKKARVRALHAKIANRRKDFLHKLSTRLVVEHGAIFVGNVNAAALAKTRMAKSVLDAGWSMFRTMLNYKSDDAGAWFEEVNEAYSTRTCSECGALSGPSGLQGLGIREWICSSCGTTHHRDVNASKVILARGHARLAGGIPLPFRVSGSRKAEVGEDVNMDGTWSLAFGGQVKEEVVLSKVDSAVGREIPVKLLTYPDGSRDLFRPQGNQFREHLVEAKVLLRKRGLRTGAVELMAPTGGYLPVWEKRADGAAALGVASSADHRALSLAPFEGHAALLALEEAPIRARRVTDV